MLLDSFQARGCRRCDREHTVVTPGELLLRHSVEGGYVDFDQLGADDAEILTLLCDSFAPVVRVLRI